MYKKIISHQTEQALVQAYSQIKKAEIFNALSNQVFVFKKKFIKEEIIKTDDMIEIDAIVKGGILSLNYQDVSEICDVVVMSALLGSKSDSKKVLQVLKSAIQFVGTDYSSIWHIMNTACVYYESDPSRISLDMHGLVRGENDPNIIIPIMAACIHKMKQYPIYFDDFMYSANSAANNDIKKIVAIIVAGLKVLNLTIDEESIFSLVVNTLLSKNTSEKKDVVANIFSEVNEISSQNRIFFMKHALTLENDFVNRSAMICTAIISSVIADEIKQLVGFAIEYLKSQDELFVFLKALGEGLINNQERIPSILKNAILASRSPDTVIWVFHYLSENLGAQTLFVKSLNSVVSGEFSIWDKMIPCLYKDMRSSSNGSLVNRFSSENKSAFLALLHQYTTMKNNKELGIQRSE